MTASYDIAIAGGGLNGLTLAHGLAASGFSVALIDAGKPVDKSAKFDGRAYALALTSRNLLAALGFWEDLRETAQPMLEIKVSDGRPGEGASPWFMHFEDGQIEEGPMGFMVEDRHLRPVLTRALRAAGVSHLHSTTVTDHALAGSGVNLTLSGGETLAAKLLIACDGRASPTAKRAGIRRTQWDYDQTGLVTAVAHERAHEGIAHQFFMPAGPLAILPLRGNVSSLVWTERNDEAARLSAASDEEYLQALRPRFGDFLGAIKLKGARASFPLGLSLAQDLIGPRLALVGDAAHGLHPIAGQGLNAGMRDVAALCEVLTNAARRGEDIGGSDVLARYRQWRRFDIAALALATDGFNRLFSNDDPGLRWMRDAGMGLLNRLPGLKRGFIREAAGLTGDVPRLMQGQPL